jgi:holo-[acyl-carrier protein] synthase
VDAADPEPRGRLRDGVGRRMGGLVGIGLDVVEVKRMGALLARLPAAEARLFTPAERAYCRRFNDATQHFAARFAAKEAVGKALGTGVLGWRDIEVGSGGRPRVRLHGSAAATACREGIGRIELSLSHTAAQAFAVAAAVKEGDHA